MLLELTFIIKILLLNYNTLTLIIANILYTELLLLLLFIGMMNYCEINAKILKNY